MSCITFEPKSEQESELKIKTEKTLYPTLEETTKNNIGDILLSQSIRTTYPAIEILHDMRGPGILACPGKIIKGTYIAVYKNGSDVIFKPMPDDVIMNKAVGDYLFLVYSLRDGLNMAWYAAFGPMAKGKAIKKNNYKLTRVTVESSSDFQQTLIYAGKEGNIVKLTYKEYSGNLIEPSFFTDITCDLKKTDIIAFRGAEIQIIEANSTSIQYKVKNNFTLP